MQLRLLTLNREIMLDDPVSPVQSHEGKKKRKKNWKVVSLRYRRKLKIKKQLCMAAHAYNLTIQEAEAEGQGFSLAV